MTLRRLIQLSALATTPGHQGLLPISPATCWRWVNQGRLPRPFKLGPMTTVLDLDEVESFIDAAKKGGAK